MLSPIAACIAFPSGFCYDECGHSFSSSTGAGAAAGELKEVGIIKTLPLFNAPPDETGGPLPGVPGPAQTTTVTLRLQITRPPSDQQVVAYGLGEDLQDLGSRITQSLNQLSAQVGDALNKTVNDLAELKVSTFVTDNADLTADNIAGNDPFKAARLLAFTSIRLDGDTRVLLPAETDESDRQLWTVHDQMVGRAQGNRAEMIKMAVSAIAGLVDLLKKP